MGAGASGPEGIRRIDVQEARNNWPSQDVNPNGYLDSHVREPNSYFRHGLHAVQSTTVQRGELRNQHQIPHNVVDTRDELVFETYFAPDGTQYAVLNQGGTRFYLDSWQSGEWQPLPESWLYHGHIKRNISADMADNVERSQGEIYNGYSVSHENDIPLNMTSSPTNHNDVNVQNDRLMFQDDRSGIVKHPTRGNLSTYFFEEKVNVHCFFDNSSGSWLKLPITWELRSSYVQDLIKRLQESIPEWDDELEILAMLRQCNYDIDEAIITYLTIKDTDENFAHRNNLRTPLLDKNIEQLKSDLAKTEAMLKELEKKNEKLQMSNKDSNEKSLALQNKILTLEAELLQLKKTTVKLEVNRHQNSSNKRPKSPDKSALRGFIQITEHIKKYSIELKADIAHLVKVFRQMISEVGIKLTELVEQSVDSFRKIEELTTLYRKEALQRRLLHNKVQELQGNIKVLCRCRFDPRYHPALSFPNESEIAASLGIKDQRKSFKFDRVFSPTSTQQEIFETVRPLITSTMDGYNVSIMAYGQTGSGKTFTMMGTKDSPGVNVRTVRELLELCHSHKTIKYNLKMSMLEIYNEGLFDLLCEENQSQNLEIRSKGKNMSVTGLTEEEVNTFDDVERILTLGEQNRSVAETKMNSSSSRSHLVVIINVTGMDQVSGQITNGKLMLVDLAGSERISKTEATGQRLVEAAAINKSLTSLGQVFSALKSKALHVPYRNSKLTYLLQGALGGDGKACLFVMVSPAQENLTETLSTLQFGSAARQVQLGKATKNVITPAN